MNAVITECCSGSTKTFRGGRFGESSGIRRQTTNGPISTGCWHTPNSGNRTVRVNQPPGLNTHQEAIDVAIVPALSLSRPALLVTASRKIGGPL